MLARACYRISVWNVRLLNRKKMETSTTRNLVANTVLWVIATGLLLKHGEKGVDVDSYEHFGVFFA